MQKVLKKVIISVVITALTYFALLSAAALIIMKKDIDFEYYRFFLFGINACVSLAISLLFRNDEKSFIFILPLFLFNALCCIILKGVSVNFIINSAIIISVYLILKRLLIKKNGKKKRNINQIRRDYERLRKQ